MKRVLVAESRRSVGEMLKVQVSVSDLEDEYQLETCYPEEGEDMKAFVKGKVYDYAVIEASLLKDRCKAESFGGIPLYGYTAGASADIKLLDSLSIPYMGIAPRSEDLMKIIEDIDQGKVPQKRQRTEREAPAATVQDTKATEARKIQSILDDEDEDVPMSAEEIASAMNGKPLQKEPVVREPAKPEPEQKEETVARPEPRSQSTTPEKTREMQIRSYDEEFPVREEETEQKKKRHTKVISVWSSKGGVGKSTLSCNIASFISMIQNGRTKYKVCLVDYNIESGDDRAILGFKGDKLVDMGIWAEDIHQMIQRGINPNDIEFTREQIFHYLEEYDERMGLHVLLAPTLYETAQFIETDEIRVMLRNVINNGGFDYVICDTADDTSDAVMCAMEESDMILLVNTQDVTTAQRNAKVLRTLRNNGIDMSKFRMVINNVTSKHRAGVSVAEVESFFDEFECIGRIHECTEVLHANNYAAPLVKNRPQSEFTKDLRKVVMYILNKKDEEEKKSILGSLFGKK